MSAIFVLILVSLYILTIAYTSSRMIIGTKKLKDNKRLEYIEEATEDSGFYSHMNENKRYKYYDYVRDEIKREDEITHQRLTAAINFHAFLINAFAFVLVFGWKDNPVDIVIYRRVAIIAIGVVGLTFSFSTLVGILASRRSIDDTKERWSAINDVWGGFYPKFVPQTFGQNKAFSWGRISAVTLPIGLITLWALLTVGHLVVYIRYA